MLDRELLIHPALRLHQPLLTRPRHRPRVLLAPGFDISPGLAQPRLPPLRPDLVTVRIEIHLNLGDHLLTRLDRGGALTLKPLSSGLQRRPAALAGAKLLGQLIPSASP